jgi:transcriptional regulator with XRE-family HTH domain
MSERSEILRTVMNETGTSQSRLSRLSGVHQPSISQFLSGKVDLSDEKLDHLLSSMGYRLEVIRRPVRPELNRSEMRSWRLHREISARLNRASLEKWQGLISENLRRIEGQVRGEPHLSNLRRWEDLVNTGDLGQIHRVLTSLSREGIEMREVSPMSGILSQEDRTDLLESVP